MSDCSTHAFDVPDNELEDGGAAVFDLGKTQEAIKRAIELFAELELTIAETAHAVNVLNATVKAEYPDVYRLMNGLK